MAPILHPSLFLPITIDFENDASQIQSIFSILNIEFSHVTCFGQWTLAVVIQEEA